MAKLAFTHSVVLTSLIGLSACGSHMTVGDGSPSDLPISVDGQGGSAPMVDDMPDIDEPELEIGSCGDDVYVPTSYVKPVDIIFVIDNSGSMNDEIEAVENNINENFAQIIENSGLDYRVIMLSQHGSSLQNKVCIEPPLADWSSEDVGCKPQDLPGINEGKFYHYAAPIGSTDSLKKVHRQFEGNVTDWKGLAKGGYKQWLRPEALKIFIEISDDKVDYTVPEGWTTPALDDQNTVAGGEQVAAAFDAALLELSPAYFGTPEARNYRWYSIVGMAGKNPADPTQPWLPGDEIETKRCKSVVNNVVKTAPSAGTGYQALSRLTGGLRFPICEKDGYDVVFNHVAEGIIAQQQVDCEYPLPEAPEGKSLYLPSLSVDYTAGGESTSVAFEQVASAEDCTDGSFYVDGDVVRLCSSSCATVQADLDAQVDVSFDCTTDIK